MEKAKENRKTMKGGRTWRQEAVSWAAGLAAAAALVLLCLAPEDGEPVLTWQLLATKAGGAALLLAADRIFRRYGGQGDDE